MDRSSGATLQPHHVGVSVADLDASIAWYTEMLGFALEKRASLEGLPWKIAFLRNGDFRIELFEVEGASPLPEGRKYPNRDVLTHGTKHIAYRVDDTAGWVERLKGKGADIAMDVRVVDNTVIAFIRDNTGNLIELFQPRDRREAQV